MTESYLVGSESPAKLSIKEKGDAVRISRYKSSVSKGIPAWTKEDRLRYERVRRRKDSEIDWRFGVEIEDLGAFTHELGHLTLRNSFTENKELEEIQATLMQGFVFDDTRLHNPLIRGLVNVIENARALEEIKAWDLGQEILTLALGDISPEDKKNLDRLKSSYLKEYDKSLAPRSKLYLNDDEDISPAYSETVKNLYSNIKKYLLTNLGEGDITQIRIRSDGTEYRGRLEQIIDTYKFVRRSVNLGVSGADTKRLLKYAYENKLSVDNLPAFDDDSGEPLAFLLKSK